MAGRGLGLGEKSCQEDRTLPALEPGAAEGSKGHLSCQGWAAWAYFLPQLSLVFTWGAGEGSVGRGHGALLSAQERSMRGLKLRSRGGLQERSGRGGGEAGERGRHLGQELPSLSEPESRI